MKQKNDIIDQFIDSLSELTDGKKLLKLFIMYCLKTKTFPDQETLKTYLEVFQNLKLEVVNVFMFKNKDLIERVINLIQRNNVFYQQKTISDTKEIKIIPLIKHIFCDES